MLLNGTSDRVELSIGRHNMPLAVVVLTRYPPLILRRLDGDDALAIAGRALEIDCPLLARVALQALLVIGHDFSFSFSAIIASACLKANSARSLHSMSL